jgi:drug/metabolite transporter (DMT)-like permease
VKIRVSGRAGQDRPGARRRAEAAAYVNPGQEPRYMSATDRASAAPSPGHWLANQPYLLLSITALCWAGNAIVGRLAAGHIPPVTLSFLRWSLAFLIILPFAWKHLRQDWPAIRGRLGTMIVLSVTGIGAFNTLQYWALEHTQALNTLLLQSAGPLFVAIWSLILLGVRLTLAQAGGIILSLTGVLVILLHGDLTALTSIEFNKGDIIFTVALVIFGLYSVLTLRRPKIHGLSFVGFTFGCGAACLIPLLIRELLTRPVMALDATNLLSLFYVAVFPSTVAYLCFNRGVHLIGANRAAPFFHLVPVFGSVMAIAFLGERPQAFHIIGFALVLTGVFVASRRQAPAA